MAGLRIRVESPSRRCEVCHQSDCFDAAANYCSRCTEIRLGLETQKSATKFDEFEKYMFIGSIAGPILAILFPGLAPRFWGIGMLAFIFSSTSIGAITGAILGAVASLIKGA